MVVHIGNVLRVEQPTDDLLIWCKQNLEIPNPEYAKKLRMGFLVGKTPKTLCLYEKRGNDLVLPFGTLKMIPQSIVDTAVFNSDFKGAQSVFYDADVPLWDYQKQAVDAMMRANYGILQSPAGSGKTQMGIALAIKLEKRTLWLCHTLDLIKQSRDRALQYIDPLLIGTIEGGKVDLGYGITFATIQTMSKLDLAQYKDYWDCIITDEVHRVSGSPTAVTQYQKVLNSLAARHKYGLSATVHRADGMIQATFALVGGISYKVPDSAVAERIEKVGIYPITTGVEMSEDAENPDGTINYVKLINYLAECESRNKLIVDTICADKQYAGLVLSDRVGHLQTLQAMLPPEMQMQSALINGKMTGKKGKAEREQAIEDMRHGKKKLLFATYQLAKEGLDIPRLERLYLTTPQSDYAVITQAIGRIARHFDDKAEPIAYDFVDRIDYLERAYKKRCRTYRKNGCYFTQ